MKAVELQTGHLYNPVGIDDACPGFSWKCEDGIRQSAYQIKACKADGMILWDSGKIAGAMTTNIRWGGKPLESRRRVYWRIRLWDETDQAGEWSEEAFFEEGLLDASDWNACWIEPELKREKHMRQRAGYLRKIFSIGKMGSARLYVTAHGIYDVWLNGSHVDGYLLAPGTSQYDKRLQVQTYEVSGLLQEGNNEVLVSLGDGWYRGSTNYDMAVNSFGEDIALLLQLEIDGETVVMTDSSWEASQNGPLGRNDPMMGEEYDARKETITGWHAVKVADYGYANLIGTNSVPVSGHEQFQAKLIRTPAGEQVLDFGQVIAGQIQFMLHAHDGERLILTHGETLDENGNFTIRNFQNPQRPHCYQKIDYICKEGENQYRNTKCYFGFRYIKVEGDVQIDGSEFTATAIYSDMKQTGYFSCGNKEVNQLFANALWSMKGNFVDIPTDCPTREKSGYSGDAQVFAHTAMYLMDCWPVLTRWLCEQEATQGEDGCVKQIAPDSRAMNAPMGMNGGAGWCDSFEIIPWRLANRYRDDSFIEVHYDAIRRWMVFCLERARKTKIIDYGIPKELRGYFGDQGMHWGEWLEPGQSVAEQTIHFFKMVFYGEPEVATAYLSYGCRIMSELAGRLGKRADAEYFIAASKKARAAYRFRYIKDGKVKNNHHNRQCRYVRPLALGLLKKEERRSWAEELAACIHKNDSRLNTGFLTTHELCRVLTDNGQVETAYDLLLQTKMPGWLYPVRKGATTVWESWDGMDEKGRVKNSFNHYSYGSIAGWLFDRVCGIVVGQGKIILRPYPDPRLGHASATYHSPLGTIVSSWCYEGDTVTYQFDVPANQEAEIILPDGRRKTVGPGHFCM